MRPAPILQQKLLYAAHNCVRNLPCNYTEADAFRFANDFERPTYDIHRYDLAPVCVTSEGVLLDKLGIVEPLTIKNYLSDYGKKYWLKKYWLLPKQNLQQKAVFCFDEWSKGLFHWICDVLPKLICLREEAPGSVLLLPHAVQEFHLQSIMPLGFGSVHSIARNRSIWAGAGLTTVSEIAITGNYHASLMHTMRQLFDSYFPLRPELNFGERIYASRARARRKLANEANLEPTFEKYGFRKFFLEDYTFIEQLSIVRHAKCFAAVHGASLAFMAFMQPQTRILEIRNETDTHNLCYFALATDMQQPYFYALAKPIQTGLGNHSDLVLPQEQLERVLGQITA